MELADNHFSYFDIEKSKFKNIFKFNRVDEFVKSKLIITKVGLK